jgi:hypothetical protein
MNYKEIYLQINLIANIKKCFENGYKNIKMTEHHLSLLKNKSSNIKNTLLKLKNEKYKTSFTNHN